MFIFINDHEPKMNCIAASCEEIQSFIETNWDTSFEDINEIEGVTMLLEVDNHQFEDESVFTDLRKCNYITN